MKPLIMSEMKFFGTGWSRYRVELELGQSGESGSDCIVYHDPHGTDRKTGCQASLECLQDTGYLEAPSGSMHKVESGMINDIARWAEENGY